MTLRLSSNETDVKRANGCNNFNIYKFSMFELIQFAPLDNHEYSSSSSSGANSSNGF